MKFLHRPFPAGHFVISLLFLGGALALVGEVQREAHMSAATRMRRYRRHRRGATCRVGPFIWFNRSAEQLEPEAMQAAKREDRKIERTTKGEDKR